MANLEVSTQQHANASARVTTRVLAAWMSTAQQRINLLVGRQNHGHQADAYIAFFEINVHTCAEFAQVSNSFFFRMCERIKE